MGGLESLKTVAGVEAAKGVPAVMTVTEGSEARVRGSPFRRRPRLPPQALLRASETAPDAPTRQRNVMLIAAHRRPSDRQQLHSDYKLQVTDNETRAGRTCDRSASVGLRSRELCPAQHHDRLSSPRRSFEPQCRERSRHPRTVSRRGRCGVQLQCSAAYHFRKQ